MLVSLASLINSSTSVQFRPPQYLGRILGRIRPFLSKDIKVTSLSKKAKNSKHALQIIIDCADEVYLLMKSTQIKYFGMYDEDALQNIYLHLLKITEERYNNNYCISTYISGVTKTHTRNFIRDSSKRINENLDTASSLQSEDISARDFCIRQEILEIINNEDVRMKAIITGFANNLTLEEIARLPEVKLTKQRVSQIIKSWISDQKRLFQVAKNAS